MKLKRIIVPIISGIMAFTTTAFAGDNTAGQGPSAFLPEQLYTFEQVAEGAEILHDFILRNNGDETLFIKRIKSG